jgi:hypothetical protein
MEARSTGTAGQSDTRQGAARTLAQTFCLVVGAVLVVVGVLGGTTSSTSPPGRSCFSWRAPRAPPCSAR